MATIDYKDKYEKAVQAAMLAKQDTESAVTIGILEEIFPELKESEDEKIRKEIIATIHLYYGEPLENEAKEMIAWLEKQGENTHNKELSELLHKVICRFINDPNIPYTEREKVSMEIIPYVERLEKQGEQKPAWSEEDEKHIMAIDLAVNRCDGKWDCCGEKCPISEHNPWLTPDQARRAVEIAREETLQEVKEKLLIMLNTSIDNKHFFEQLDDYIEELEQSNEK